MDRWRILVVNRWATEVLVRNERGLSAFPELGVPENDRAVPHIRRGFARDWQLDMVCLFPIDLGSNGVDHSLPRYYLAELQDPRAMPDPLRWAAAASLTRERFRDDRDFQAVSAFLARTEPSGPFASPGALLEISGWVEQLASREGFTWSGGFEQYQASSRFSLVRFETAPRALWFKAVGEPNEREFPLTTALARLCPQHVPRILGTRPEWNAWLAEECPGSTLDEVREVVLWRDVARALAELQIASLPHAGELLLLGAHRWESVFSQASLDRFREGARKLAFANRARDACAQVQAAIPGLAGPLAILGIPAALGHLDLNAGNIIASRERGAFLDWAEAYVGFPFATFAYLLEAFRCAFGRSARDEASFVDAYLGPWRRVLAPGPVREAWSLAPVLALFAYTARCLAGCEPRYAPAPHVQSYLEALVVHLGRQLEGFPQAFKVRP
jgi:hypothetical protein